MLENDNDEQAGRPNQVGENAGQHRLIYRPVNLENIYFRDWIVDDFKNSRYPLPDDIIKGRNCAITLAVPEMICCFLSVGLYEVRRSRLILAMVVMNIIMTAIGIRAKLKLSYWGLMAHGLYSISLIGGFYIYVLVDFFI